MKTIATFSKEWEADLVIARLRADGFHPPDLATGSHVTLWGADQGWYVRVPEKEVKAAQGLLRDNGYEKSLV